MRGIWSSTALPFDCLIDEKRVQLLKEAIKQLVKPGDVVIDLGSGSGILSFLAADAGAKMVYAIEIDTVLATALANSVKANGFQDIIQVIEGDLLEVRVPQQADVVMGEMIDTGLIDEMQVPIFNRMIEQRVITDNTKVIPARYTTFLRLVHADFNFYGYQILVPIHRWPHYDVPHTGWYQKEYCQALSRSVAVATIDFHKTNEPKMDRILDFFIEQDGIVNAVVLSGLIEIAPGIESRVTNALNSDKIIPIASKKVTQQQSYKLHVSYEMGESLTSFRTEWVL